MDIGSILILLALILLVVLFLARPVIDHKGNLVSQEEHELSALLAERDRTLNALQELDFDYTLGKIPEEDYPIQRTHMLQYGADILRKLDNYEFQLDSDKVEDRIEHAIAAQKTARQPSAAAVLVANGNGGNHVIHPDDDLETKIAERRRSRKEKATGFCHQCGSPLQQSDRFCPRCGNDIS
jgi:hypothetical protein